MRYCSKEEARHILCRYHNLDGAEPLCGKEGVEAIMQRIHSIQYDPLNVVARNADLVLQARVDDYSESVLYDLLYKEHKFIDGYDKEMCIYSANDFARLRYVRAEYAKYAVPVLRHRNQLGALDLLDEVRDFVEAHGRTGTKDISIGNVREGSWGHKKLSSAALDYLFNTGILAVADKRGTQKFFDLTERVIDSGSLACVPDMSLEQFLEWYIERRIQSVGLLWNRSGSAWQGRFLNENDLRSATLQTLAAKDRIEEIQVEGIKEPFYRSKDSEKYMAARTAHSYARFLAPLDNLLWDRQMLEMLFGFSYRWEVYTPVAKRKFGYYVLPVLYNDRFVARFEAEPVREAGAFVVRNWWWEPQVVPNDEMRETIAKEMARFAAFLQVENAPQNSIKLGV